MSTAPRRQGNHLLILIFFPAIFQGVRSSPPVAASANATAALSAGAPVSSLASPKRHSFGKSTPPPKPKPPANATLKSAAPRCQFYLFSPKSFRTQFYRDFFTPI
jgi:hypothetical protein